jgi:hypothetical protein
MQATLVDPRDQRWEENRPRYRVTLWKAGYRGSADYDVTDATDVEEVLRWARENIPAAGHYTVAVVADIGGSLGLIVIAGDASPPGVEGRPASLGTHDSALS